jgi:hypothetical protein
MKKFSKRPTFPGEIIKLSKKIKLDTIVSGNKR